MISIKKTLAMLLVVATVPAIAVSPAFALDDQNAAVESSFTDSTNTYTEEGIMPLRSSHYFSIGTNYVSVYSSSTTSLNGLVTVNVQNFNAALYQVDINVYGKNGLLWSEDNWTKASSSNVFTAVDVRGISLRIKPRAALITPARNFTVEVIY